MRDEQERVLENRIKLLVKNLEEVLYFFSDAELNFTEHDDEIIIFDADYFFETFTEVDRILTRFRGYRGVAYEE